MSIRRSLRDPDGVFHLVDETYVGLVARRFEAPVYDLAETHAIGVYAEVWDPSARRMAEVLVVSDALDDGRYLYKIVPDCPLEITQSWQDSDEGRRLARIEKEAEDAARNEILAMVEGARVRLLRDEYPAVEGSEGYIASVVGFPPDVAVHVVLDGGSAIRVPTEAVRVIVPGLRPEETPASGWRSFLQRTRRAREAVLDLAPMGAVVRLARDHGTSGRVTWRRGTRLGFKHLGSEVVWATVFEVERLEGSTWSRPPSRDEAYPRAVPSSGGDLRMVPTDPISVSTYRGVLSATAFVGVAPDGSGTAFDLMGRAIANVPNETILRMTGVTRPTRP